MNGKLVQANTQTISGEFQCPECKNEGIYDDEKNAQFEQSRRPRRMSVIGE